MDRNILQSYIKELRRGSHKAFDAIYDMYADRLYSFALAHTKSQHIAGDIVQDTFLHLWSIRESLSVEGSLQSLLFTIAKHRFIDVFRKQINQKEMELYIIYKEEARQEDNFETDTKLLYDDFVKILKLCKKLLTNRQLEIFELSREKGKSIEEISELLNISEQTVKNQLTTALKKIRAGLHKTGIIYLISFVIFIFFR
ncbi:MAG: sigma-70 family RNA polymerase sigma factor [Pigmentiphaga sp.]|nr:sigma-70 family RNA polymerase sigma factor [Pigmentiphaga sp.]